MNRNLPAVSPAALESLESPVSLAFKMIAYVLVIWASLSSGAVSASEIKVFLGTVAVAAGDRDGDSKNFFQAAVSPLAASLTSSSHGKGGSTAYGKAYASADYGVLKARGEGATYYPGGGGADQVSLSNGGAQISFSDVLVFHSSPALNGLRGYVTTNWLAIWDLIAVVDGGGAATLGNAGGSASLDVRFGSRSLVSEVLNCPVGGPCKTDQYLEIDNKVVPFSKAFTVTSAITFGEETPLSAYFHIDGAANARGADGADFYGAAFGDRSAYWDGIEEVTFEGKPVAFTVTSGSGTDYSRSFVPTSAVPEPPAFWLMITGLLLIVWAGHRQPSLLTA